MCYYINGSIKSDTTKVSDQDIRKWTTQNIQLSTLFMYSTVISNKLFNN